MIETPLVSKSKAYAEEILSALPDSFAYHNLSHTREVVEAAQTIGKATNLNEDEMETLTIAAWLHDTGFRDGCDNHEEKSKVQAHRLLTDWGASEKKLAEVMAAIDATRMPQNPKTAVEKVLCDADLFHLATDQLMDVGMRLRQEMKATKGIEYTDEEWVKHNLSFFKNHSYFTDYGKSILAERKKKNIQFLKNLKDQNGKPRKDKKYVKELEKELEKARKKIERKSFPERGIETMFRITAENHITLSGMADTKANIMVSINSIILSVVVSVLFRKFEEFPNLLIPTLMLVTACLITIVFAVLATRPKISSGKFSEEDIKQKRTNLLFFGNFHGMKLEQYQWGMGELMKDADYLYGSLTKDIYYNGKVLARKYRYLRWSYTTFMFGFVASIIAFIVALLLFYYPG
ncbi:MAG: Pycsar system effector family protein [Cyclobacteriaceae bacterium]